MIWKIGGSFLARYRHSGELSLTRLISAMDRAPSPKSPFENPSLSHFHALNAASQMRETGGFLWFGKRSVLPRVYKRSLNDSANPQKVFPTLSSTVNKWTQSQ